jgi:hypothetical protein
MQSGVVGPKSGDWIVHPDLVLGLRLIREGNEWLSPEDGYEKVIELVFSDDGRPARLSIRAEYLKDFLCARGMALYVTSYRSHRDRGPVRPMGSGRDSRTRRRAKMGIPHQ